MTMMETRGLTRAEMQEVAILLQRVVPKGSYEEHLISTFVTLYGPQKR